MRFDDGEEEREFVEWVRKAIGAAAAAAFDEEGDLGRLQDRVRQAWQIQHEFGVDGDRAEAARAMIERLVPNMIDVELWRNVALGRNVHLPASAQYGPISKRVQPSDEKVRRPPRGNAYGKGHDKLDDPAQFFERQGKAIARESAEIARLEQERREAEQRLADLESGLATYATTCLLTQMRKATAPVFAMGPAWTILRAIAGPTGREKTTTDQEVETHRIMVVCHALREMEDFEKELKSAMLKVCNDFQAAAAKRGKPFTEFDGPHDYEAVLKKLAWPGSADEGAHHDEAQPREAKDVRIQDLGF
jgi:hypothetical protein